MKIFVFALALAVGIIIYRFCSTTKLNTSLDFHRSIDSHANPFRTRIFVLVHCMDAQKAAQQTSFNQPLNNWNVSNVTNMESMFENASSFNQPLNNWNVSNVRNMNRMFFGASSFNQPLNKWDVSKVEDMGAMFCGAISFNQPLNNWDVRTRMCDMFSGATSFNQPLHAPWYAVEQSDSE